MNLVVGNLEINFFSRLVFNNQALLDATIKQDNDSFDLKLKHLHKFSVIS